MEEYLTTKELSAITKYRPQTIYNLINKGILVEGVHFLKPARKMLLCVSSEVPIPMIVGKLSQRRANDAFLQFI